MPILSALILFLFSFQAAALTDEISSEAQEAAQQSTKTISSWPASEVREIRIFGMTGALDLRNSESSQVTVRFEDWNADSSHQIKTELKDGVLSVTADLGHSAAVGAISLARVNLKISGPAKKLSAHFAEGNITVSQWASDAKIRLVKGKVQVSKSRGHFEIFYRRGNATITDHEGVVGIDTVYGTIAINGGKGDLSVANFSGSSSIDNYEGALSLTSHNGSHRLNKNKGDLNYELSQSELSLAAHEGKITGDGKDSVVRLGYLGKASIRVKSAAGNVFIKSPKSSGARVNVGSVEGFLGIPGYIKATQWPSIKVASGRLDGFRPGSIHVRTQSGAVYLR